MNYWFLANIFVSGACRDELRILFDPHFASTVVAEMMPHRFAVSLLCGSENVNELEATAAVADYARTQLTDCLKERSWNVDDYKVVKELREPPIADHAPLS